jgi:hypothetical protein
LNVPGVVVIIIICVINASSVVEQCNLGNFILCDRVAIVGTLSLSSLFATMPSSSLESSEMVLFVVGGTV